MQKIKEYFLYGLAVFPFLGILTETFIQTNVIYVWGILSLILVLLITISQRGKVRVPLYLKYFFFFLLYTMIRNYMFSDLFSVINLFKNRFLFFFTISLIIENTQYDNKLIKNYKKLLILLFISSFLITLVQIFNRKFLINPAREQYMEFVYGNRNRFPSIYSWSGGRYSTSMTTLSISAIFIHDFIVKQKPKMIAIVLTIAAFIIFLTQTRWGMVGFFILLFVFYLYSNRKNKIFDLFKILLISVIITIIIINLLPFVGINTEKIVNDRILQTDRTLVENSGYTRILAFKYFARFFPKQPIFGNGGFLEDDLIRFIGGRSSQIHVGYLQLFYFYGLLGGTLYLLFFYNLIKRSYKLGKHINVWFPFMIIIIYAWSLMTLVYLGPLEPGIFSALIFYRYYNDKNNYYGQRINYVQ